MSQQSTPRLPMSLSVGALLFIVGCGGLKVKQPDSVKGRTSPISVQVDRHISFLGKKEGKVTAKVGPFSSRSLHHHHRSTSQGSVQVNQALKVGEVLDNYYYKFSLSHAPSGLALVVDCEVSQRMTNSSYQLDQSSSISSSDKVKGAVQCEATQDDQKVGLISIETEPTERSIEREFRYKNAQYKLQSIHEVESWNLKRRSPYGYLVSRGDEPLAVVQVDYPQRILALPELSSADQEAVAYLLLSAAYYRELFVASTRVF